jgi:hypothetical protein
VTFGLPAVPFETDLTDHIKDVEKDIYFSLSEIEEPCKSEPKTNRQQVIGYKAAVYVSSLEVDTILRRGHR